MKPLQFTIANVTSAIGWAPVYMLPGILLGAASQELPPDIAAHVVLVLLLIILFCMLCLWFIYKLLQLISVQLDQIQNQIWHWLKRSRQLAPITILLKHHNPERTHGQLNLAFYFLVSSFLFLCLAFYVDWRGPYNIQINNALFHFFRGIRTKGLDTIMIDLTLLGQKQIILPVVVVFFGWLIFLKRWRVAFHALALGILAAGGVFVFKHLLKSPRPWGIYINPESYSMPSGHATLATTVFMGLAFLIASSIRPKFRWPIYIIGILIAFVVGLSRLYLGAHWFTDVLTAWLLSAAVLLFVIISYEHKKEKPINPLGILLVSLGTLILTYGLYYHQNFTKLKTNYQPLNWPILSIPMDKWWQQNDLLAVYRVSLFGVPSSAINIEWAGNIESIKKTLLKEGWVEPPARDFISTLHRIADVKSTQYLPMVSPQYLDKKPELILIRHPEGKKQPLVLRLWDSNRLIKNTNTIVWVGMINLIPRTYSWLYKSNQETINIDPSLLFPKKTGSNKWEWKMILMNKPDATHKLINQKILLLRENKFLPEKK
jgi:membrane-associated phospholipid phosphatase